jgi:hypothetical protein
MPRSTHANSRPRTQVMLVAPPWRIHDDFKVGLCGLRPAIGSLEVSLSKNGGRCQQILLAPASEERGGKPAPAERERRR